MRYHQILFEMTVPQAAAVFKSHGVDPTNIKDLKQSWLRLVKSNHPDAGGDTRTMQMINAAYDVLKQSEHDEPADDGHSGTPVWAWAGHSGGMAPSGHISREDYRDVNYIKKRMWELSDHSREEWSITGFDGAFLRASTTVFGAPSIFAQMAEAMVIWQTKSGNPYPCRAVIVNKRRQTNEVYLIWADGVSYARDPIPLQYDSFNENPSNDSSFERRLRNLIDEMRDNGGRMHDQPEMDGMGGGEQQRETFDTGSYVYHPKYGVGRIIHPTIKKGMARVAFIDQTGNVRASLLRRATKAEERQFRAADHRSS